MEIILERIRQDWSRDEISVPVLASLLLQIVLIVFSLFRKRQASYLPSILLWLSYLGADYVATFALGNLLNKQNEALGENSTSNLAAFWGPFLLLHLGGPDTITSYSLEDNQLWLRHLLGMLLQVSIAIFLFLKSLPNPHLWQAAIAVFAAGILKYGERTWSLRSASKLSSMLREFMIIEPVVFTKDLLSRNPGVENPCPNFQDQITKMNNEEIIERAHRLYQIFLNILAEFDARTWYRSWYSLGRINSKQVFQGVEIELSLLHDTLHTKAAHVHNVMGCTMRVFSFTMIVLSLVLFCLANKEDFKPGEIRITYILLIAALVIEIIAIVLLVLSDWTIIALQQSDREKKFGRLIVKIQRVALGEIAMRRWSNSMKQYNFIRLCLRNNEWKRFNNKWYVCLREKWDGWFRANQQTVSDDLKDLIFNELKDKFNEAPDSICNNYIRLCASRGEWVLLRKSYTNLHWSVEKEFDESILVWHIATNLCYIEDLPQVEAATVGQDARKEENKNIPIISQAIGKLRKFWCAAEPSDKDVEQNLLCATTQDDKAKFLRERLEISKKISEYIMFLLWFKPSMFPVGIGKIRFQNTCKDTMALFSDISEAPVMKAKDEDVKLAQERNANSIGCKDTLRAIGSKLMEIWKIKEPNLISREKMEQEKEKVACEMLRSVESSRLFPRTWQNNSQLDDACTLAQQLQVLFKERREEKWEVISAVWVEMLCYAAGRCSTMEHAKQLSQGGEL